MTAKDSAFEDRFMAHAKHCAEMEDSALVDKSIERIDAIISLLRNDEISRMIQ